MKRFLLVGLCFLLSSIFPLFFCPLQASASENRVVRVAYPIEKGFTELDGSGGYRGYTYDYLEEISQYTGWTLELVQADGDKQQQDSAFLEMLVNGEIDLIGGMFYSDEMAEKLRLTTQSYGVAESVLQTSAGRAGELNLFSDKKQPLRIAVLEGAETTKLNAFCDAYAIEPEYLNCQNTEQLAQMVRENRADVLFGDSTKPISGMYTVASIARRPFYFAVSKHADEQIAKDIDKTLVQIAQSSPAFSQALSEKYFSMPESHAFSQAERDYIAKSGILRVGVMENQPPYYYALADDNKGIIIDFVKVIGDKTGLEFEFVPAPDRETLYQWAREGRIDLVTNQPCDTESARENGLSVTEPYLTCPYVLVMNQGTAKINQNGKRLALTSTGIYRGYTVGNVVRFRSMSDCVKAVINGQADYTYVDSCTMQYFSNLPEFWDLRQTQLSYKPLELSFGLPVPAKQELRTVLNKAILSITVEQRQAIITNNTIPEHRLSFHYVLREYPLQIVACFLFVILILLVWMRQRVKSQNLFKEEMDKRNQLYAMLDDHFFEYQHSTQVLRIQNPFKDGPDGEMDWVEVSCAGRENGLCKELLQTVKAEKDGVFEIYDSCLDGERHWLRVTQKVLYDTAGKCSCTMGKVQIIDKEKKELTQLVNQAQRDGLSGLYNVQTFHVLAENAIKELESGNYGALLLLDIDYFKIINDTYGHMQGDRAICWLSQRLTEQFGKNGIIGRYGGDEFIVYIKSVSDKGYLDALCAGFCKSICRSSQEKLTVSLGAVLSQQPDRFEPLFAAADKALYQAKGAGRNGHFVLEQLEKDGAAPCYQPMRALDGQISWLDAEAYQTVLQSLSILAFEFDTVRRTQRVSACIGNYLAGTYDARMVLDVLAEDGVVHPEDFQKFLAFREQAYSGQYKKITVRLQAPDGRYRYFQLFLISRVKPDGSQIITGIMQDVNEKTRYQAMLRRQTEYDTVSGIFNRNAFFKHTQRKLIEEKQRPHFLFCFDVLRFKMVNELFGAKEGDKVLRYIGGVLHSQARKGETFGRLGNDVFFVCVSRCKEDTLLLIKEITRKVQEYPLAFRFLLPTGIVQVEQGNSSSIQALCDKASAARQAARSALGNSCRFYNTSMGRLLGREQMMLANIENSLEQFEAYFQPQYDIRHNRVIGVEALARWRHPVLGMINPDEFIPLFERNGFIIKLDEYIWTQACKTLRSWLDRGLSPVPITVNISRVHFYHEGFAEKLLALCSRFSVPSSLLGLELSESVYAENPKELLPAMEKLQKAGFVFTMDDFGKEYSSLNMLENMPVKVIKFDLRFLHLVRKGEHAGRTLIRRILQLMRDLHLFVLVEGVETGNSSKFLQDNGCFYVQGFYYAKPMPLVELEQSVFFSMKTDGKV